MMLPQHVVMLFLWPDNNFVSVGCSLSADLSTLCPHWPWYFVSYDDDMGVLSKSTVSSFWTAIEETLQRDRSAHDERII